MHAGKAGVRKLMSKEGRAERGDHCSIKRDLGPVTWGWERGN